MKNIRSLQVVKGLSLIELLVTITITSIGLMGLVSLQMQAVRATSDSGNRSQAIWIFNDIIGRIRANEIASASYVTPANYVVAAGQDRPPVCDNVVAPVCTTYHTGVAPIPAANCTGTQQAAWDLFEVACGSPKSAGFQGNSISYLPQAQLTITCLDNPCLNGTSSLNLTLQWRAKADNESITNSARTAASGLLTITDTIAL